MLFVDRIKSLNFSDLTIDLSRPIGRGAMDSDDHEIFWGVLQRDKIEQLRLISASFEQKRSKSVRDEFRCPLEHDSVLQNIAKHFRRSQLRPQLLMTAGSNNNDRCVRLSTLIYGVVGRRIARVQSDQNIGVSHRKISDAAANEFQPVETACLRN